MKYFAFFRKIEYNKDNGPQICGKMQIFALFMRGFLPLSAFFFASGKRLKKRSTCPAVFAGFCEAGRRM